MPETYGSRDTVSERHPVVGAGEDALLSHCRLCGGRVFLCYSGTLKKGRVHRMTFRMMEADDAQLPHRCNQFARRAELSPHKSNGEMFYTRETG